MLAANCDRYWLVEADVSCVRCLVLFLAVKDMNEVWEMLAAGNRWLLALELKLWRNFFDCFHH